MNDLDHRLANLGERPLDARLAGIDDAVFAGLAAMQGAALPRAAMGVIAALAMATGILATVWPGVSAQARPVMVLGVPADLAPSSLLGEAP